MRALILATCSISMLATAAFAKTGNEPEALITEASQQVQQFLSDGVMDDAEASQIMDMLDVDRIARFALGRHARRVEQADYADYRNAFSGFLKRQVQVHFEDFQNADLRVTGSTARSDSDVIVNTEVVRGGGNDISINWRLIQRDGQWAVVDVQALGLWLALEQRAQFDAVLDRANGDIRALIDEMG